MGHGERGKTERIKNKSYRCLRWEILKEYWWFATKVSLRSGMQYWRSLIASANHSKIEITKIKLAVVMNSEKPKRKPINLKVLFNFVFNFVILIILSEC